MLQKSIIRTKKKKGKGDKEEEKEEEEIVNDSNFMLTLNENRG